MQAAVFEGIRTIRVQTIPDPARTADDIVIHVKAQYRWEETLTVTCSPHV